MSEPCIACPALPLAGNRPAQPVSGDAQPPARSAEAAQATHAGAAQAAQAAQAEAVARERWLFRHAVGAGQVHPLRHLLKRYRAGESS